MKDFMDETTGNFVGVGIYMVKDTETNKVSLELLEQSYLH